VALLLLYDVAEHSADELIEIFRHLHLVDLIDERLGQPDGEKDLNSNLSRLVVSEHLDQRRGLLDQTRPQTVSNNISTRTT
jgi:hypothetical protein